MWGIKVSNLELWRDGRRHGVVGASPVVAGCLCVETITDFLASHYRASGGQRNAVLEKDAAPKY